LGLALVKRLVAAQNGDICVTSTPGAGSCFTVTLPYVAVCEVTPTATIEYSTPQRSIDTPVAPNIQQVSAPDPPASDSRVPSNVAELLPLAELQLPPVRVESEPLGSSQFNRHKPLILLAEDNKTNIETFMLYLTHSGYEIAIANDGIEAVNLAQSLQPDLILMDIQMPGMDGFESISKIRQIPEIMHVPIVALTALAMPGDREKCLTSGADRYLSKPAKLKQLRQAIVELIGSYK
jgi:CheY-like chemotaxis protein